MDDIDIEILDLLSKDARRSNADIARNLNLSKPAIKKRLDRLSKNKTFQVFAVVDPVAFGYEIGGSIFIKVTPGQLVNVANSLLELNQVVYLGYLAGSYDLLVEVLLKNESELFDLLNTDILNIPGIISTDSSYNIQIEKISYDRKMVLELANHKDQSVEILPNHKNKATQNKKYDLNSLDKMDVRIIQLLQENGRRSNADISRKITLSESTVKLRIKKLLKNKFLKIVTIFDSKLHGNLYDVIVGLNILNGSIEKISQALLSIENIVYFAHHSGLYDIIFQVLVSDKKELIEFYSDLSNKISGSYSIDKFHVLKTGRINFEWKLPNDVLVGKDKSIVK